MSFNVANKIRVRHLSKLDYVDPEGFLKSLAEYVDQRRDWLEGLPKSILSFRHDKLKDPREWVDAAIFSVGVSRVLKTPVWFSPTEDDDYDSVLSWDSNGRKQFCPVQLKELVPAELNEQASLKQVLENLRNKYEGTLVAVKINRRGPFQPSTVEIPENLSCLNLWMYGPVEGVKSEFFISGNFLDLDNLFTGTYSIPLYSDFPSKQ